MYNIDQMNFSVTDSDFTINLGTVNQSGAPILVMLFGAGGFISGLLLPGAPPLLPYAFLLFTTIGVSLFFTQKTRITRANKNDQTVTIIDTNTFSKKSRASVYKFSDVQKIEYARFSYSRLINTVNESHIIYLCLQQQKPIKIARQYYNNKAALSTSSQSGSYKIAQDFANFIGKPLDQHDKIRPLDG